MILHLPNDMYVLQHCPGRSGTVGIGEASMDFIFMLTRNDRTIDGAARLVNAACDLGVRHIGF